MIFADSSYFIGLADQKDQWHKRAVDLSDRTDDDLVVTSLILSESVTAVGARGGGKAGVAVYDYILENCHVTFLVREMMENAVDVYLKYDGTLSLADAVSIQVMKTHDIRQILSFDSDFDKVKNIIRLS